MKNFNYEVLRKMHSKYVIFTILFIFFICCISCKSPELLPENQRKLTFDINASSKKVYDAASQVVMDYGLTINYADEKIGFIKTDYAPIKTSFVNELLLVIFSRNNEEYMLNLQIKGTRIGAILNIIPKGRFKKKSDIGEEYESMELSNSFFKRIKKIGIKIKIVAEGNEYKDIKGNNKKSYDKVTNPKKLKIIVKNANIRIKPSLSSSVVIQLSFGDLLDVEEKVGDWYKITLPPDESGFVISAYIHKSIVEVIE